MIQHDSRLLQAFRKTACTVVVEYNHPRTGDVFGSLHDEDDGDQQRENLVRESCEEQHHVRQRKHATAPRKQHGGAGHGNPGWMSGRQGRVASLKLSAWIVVHATFTKQGSFLTYKDAWPHQKHDTSALAC